MVTTRNRQKEDVVGRPDTASGDAPAAAPLLEVEGLEVSFFTRRGVVQGVRGASFTLARGETLALVGESGSGKSVTSKAILGLVDLPGRITGGDIRWKGHSLLGKKGAAYGRKVRGKEISIVFQDPMTSLNPLLTVGTQISEPLRFHRGMSKKAAWERGVELLDLVGISFPRQRMKQHPHEFSGGMNQRVIIAMALASEPEFLIADEPTTALDVTIQAQILELLAELQRELDLAVLLITHDLGVVAGLCQRVAVMYAGRIVETGPIDEIFDDPGHPYTRGLLRSTPRLDNVLPRLESIPGSPPDLRAPPSGCAFHPRCPLAIDLCVDEDPLLEFHAADRKVACHRAFEHDDPGHRADRRAASL
ncbi:MAG: ABC transporter ATP-binding protein [Actinobacteria bacterium]|nr:ABC transporter ATP-binding protein [Actinomycetota bacterium]